MQTHIFGQRQHHGLRIAPTMAKRTVRIIGGKWKGRKLEVIQRPGLRPTMDRVREDSVQLARSRCGGRSRAGPVRGNRRSGVRGIVARRGVRNAHRARPAHGGPVAGASATSGCRVRDSQRLRATLAASAIDMELEHRLRRPAVRAPASDAATTRFATAINSGRGARLDTPTRDHRIRRVAGRNGCPRLDHDQAVPGGRLPLPVGAPESFGLG